LSGEKIKAVVIGGGAVGTHKALALLDAGATVRVITLKVSPELQSAASSNEKLSIDLREYSGVADIADAELVIAATGSIADQAIAADAHELHRLVVVAGAPDIGNATSMAVHRTGPLTVGVSTGNVPSAAAKIRDAIAERFDGRYADAVVALAEIRASTLADAGSSEWARLNAVLVGRDFCERVESGAFAEVANECR